MIPRQPIRSRSCRALVVQSDSNTIGTGDKISPMTQPLGHLIAKPERRRRLRVKLSGQPYLTSGMQRDVAYAAEVKAPIHFSSPRATLAIAQANIKPEMALSVTEKFRHA